MGIMIVIDDKRIYADGYISNSNDRTIQFYRNKDDLDYIPPIEVSVNMLSDFGREVIGLNNKVINALNEIGCTSFTFSKEEIEQMFKDELLEFDT